MTLTPSDYMFFVREAVRYHPFYGEAVCLSPNTFRVVNTPIDEILIEQGKALDNLTFCDAVDIYFWSRHFVTEQRENPNNLSWEFPLVLFYEVITKNNFSTESNGRKKEQSCVTFQLAVLDRLTEGCKNCQSAIDCKSCNNRTTQQILKNTHDIAAYILTFLDNCIYDVPTRRWLLPNGISPINGGAMTNTCRLYDMREEFSITPFVNTTKQKSLPFNVHGKLVDITYCTDYCEQDLIIGLPPRELEPIGYEAGCKNCK